MFGRQIQQQQMMSQDADPPSAPAEARVSFSLGFLGLGVVVPPPTDHSYTRGPWEWAHVISFRFHEWAGVSRPSPRAQATAVGTKENLSPPEGLEPLIHDSDKMGFGAAPRKRVVPTGWTWGAADMPGVVVLVVGLDFLREKQLDAGFDL